MNKLNPRCEITMYAGDGSEPESRVVSGTERKSIDAKAYDHMLDTVRGVYGYRTADGQWIENPIDGSGMGKVTMDIVRGLQINPGMFLGTVDMAQLAADENLLANNALAARITVIRKAHDETPDKPRFFVTRRNGGGGYMWPAERSWIWIDRAR